MDDRRSALILNLVFLSVTLFFLIVIFLPSVYILKFSTNLNIFLNLTMVKAVVASFFIAACVTFLNILFGIPLAWVLARSRNIFVKIVDNLVDLSLVMPTAALGFSVFLYWGTGTGIPGLLGMEKGFFTKGPLMIILLHIIFTLPYMIRSVIASIQQFEEQNEEAAYALGASPFTFFRTIAAPLLREGIIGGSILSFTRSISETGATMMVAGLYNTAPVLIINLKNKGDISGAAGASIFLIVSAIYILLMAKLLLGERN